MTVKPSQKSQHFCSGRLKRPILMFADLLPSLTLRVRQSKPHEKACFFPRQDVDIRYQKQTLQNTPHLSCPGRG
jgi:hypothetical protein